MDVLYIFFLFGSKGEDQEKEISQIGVQQGKRDGIVLCCVVARWHTSFSQIRKKGHLMEGEGSASSRIGQLCVDHFSQTRFLANELFRHCHAIA